MKEIMLPKQIEELVKDKPYTLSDIGMSGSQVLMFEDMVLKIEKRSDYVEKQVNRRVPAELGQESQASSCLRKGTPLALELLRGSLARNINALQTSLKTISPALASPSKTDRPLL